MQDIGQELYKDIKKEFDKQIKSDPAVKRFNKKIKEEKASLSDISLYARRLGEISSNALIKCFNDKNKLPNGIIYWNIAKKTILQLLKRVHSMVNEAAIKVQKYEDSKEGIGINAIAAEFPEERAKALIQKIVDISIKEAEQNG